MNGLKPLVLSLALALSAPLLASADLQSGKGAVDMPPGIAWQAAAQDSDIDAIFKQARSDKKPVLLYWGAKWCPPCNQLKATLFNRADFIGQAQGVLPVLIDGDLPGAQKLGTRFKVRGYPTLILFNPDGQEITRLPGEADAPRVVRLLQLGLSGGRPIQAVLADANAGKTLKPAEWQLLAYYSWETDQDQLVKASERGALLQRLSQGKGLTPDLRTRLHLKALALGAAPAPDSAKLVAAVLKDSKATRAQFDVLANSADDIVKALHKQTSPERTALLAQLDKALLQQQADTKLSRADRVQVLIERVNLARIDLPAADTAPKLPQALVTEVKQLVNRFDTEIRDGYERQAVITSAAHLLGISGLWAESDALLKSNLSKSHSPYYLMNQLAGNARKTGRTTEALNWYEQAFTTSVGPATRLQWGSTYLENLIKLAPQETARIEKLAAALIAEAEKDSGAFYERSARSMKKVSDLLMPWATGANAEVLARLQTQLNGVCGKLDGKEPRSQCDAMLKPAAPKAAG